MTLTPRPRRHSERGQAVPIIAIMTTLLVAATALMVDLSLQTHNRRAVQNITDSAALAGARELGSTATQADRVDAAVQALTIMHTQLWPNQFGASWVTQTVQNSATCASSGTKCDVTVVPPAPGSSYTVAIHVPPVNSSNSLYNGKWGYVEVDLTKTTSNNFSGMMGFKTSTEAARSIAYHFAGNQAFGFALYADSVVATGNDGEKISGNVYANRYVQPQSGGQAGFCTSNGGYIIFGAPQWPDSNYDGSSGGNVGQHDTPQDGAKDYPVKSVGDCNSTDSGSVNETGAAMGNGANCSGAVSGVTFNGSWYGGGNGLNACVANPAINPPTLESPVDTSTANYCGATGLSGGSYQPGHYSCTSGTSLQVDAPLASGLYVITHDANNTHCTVANNCYDVDFKANTTLNGVTFYLKNGATIGIEQGTTVTLIPFDNTASNNPTDRGYYSIYSDGNTAAALEVLNGSTLVTSMTMYIPNGRVEVLQNSYVKIDPGQAIVGSWNVQSGYHDNPDITYDGNDAAPQREVLKLVQ
jgi:Flp pilus assembly protein TadG